MARRRTYGYTDPNLAGPEFYAPLPEDSSVTDTVVVTRQAAKLRTTFLAHAGLKVKGQKKPMTKIHRKIALDVRARQRGDYINRLLNLNESETHTMIHMSRTQLDRLCRLLNIHAGLTSSPFVDYKEKIFMFLAVMAHGTTHEFLKFSFLRSGTTVCRSFNEVQDCVVSMRELLLAHPMPVDKGCLDEPWCNFQGCVGVLDGMRLGPIDYLLAACGKDLRFTYVNTNLDGSRCPMRVLKEAMESDDILGPHTSTYYLVSSQFANAPGFLAPYHSGHCRKERDDPLGWDPKAYFNEKHRLASLSIRRAFGLLKRRFAILRNGGLSAYSRDRQLKIILACCLIHNMLHVIDLDNGWIDSELEDVYRDDPPNVEVPQYEEPNGNGFAGMRGWMKFRTSIANVMFRRWLRLTGQLDVPPEFV